MSLPPVLRPASTVRVDGYRAIAALCVLLLGSCAEQQVTTPLASAASEVAPAGAGARADSVRDAFAAALREVAQARTDSVATARLEHARLLAHHYAGEWGDSLLLRRALQFSSASRRERRDMSAADSLWRAGRDAFCRDGVPAAMGIWRVALRHAAAARDTVARGVVLNAMGAGFYTMGELDSAAVRLEESFRFATLARDYRTMGNALGNQASVSKDRGRLAAAVKQYREASAIRIRSGDSRGLAADQNNLGLIAWQLGDLDAARAAFQQALEVNRAEGRDRIAAVNLTNLAAIATTTGDYATAEASYREAIALNTAAGDDAELAFVLADLGRLEARRGDFVVALETLEQALDLHERSGAVGEALSVRSDLASVQAAAGDLQRALETLRRAEADARGAEIDADRQGTLALANADVALQLGRLGLAEQHYARAAGNFRNAGNASRMAETEIGRAVLLLLRDDDAGALDLLSAAARRQQDAGDRRAAALTRLHVAAVQRELGDTTAARRILAAALDTLTQLQDPAGAALALSGLAELATDAGAVLGAEALYRRALQVIGGRHMPHIAWRVHAGLGETLGRRGALGPAAAQLRAALDGVEQVAARLHVPERRAGFFADKWNVYASLVELERARGRDGAAFEVSERMRARRMLDVLARGRISSRTKESAREQDLRRHIRELSYALTAEDDALQGRRDPNYRGGELAPALEALSAAQREYAELLLELRESDAVHARRVAGVPVSWQAVAQRLPRHTVLVQYLLGDSVALAFVLTRDTVATVDLGATPRELRHLIDFARMAIQRADTGASALWRAPLRRLHRDLFEPIEQIGLLKDARSLIVVPHAELNFLPFGALLEPGPDERFLVQRFNITYAPSATAWLRLAERAPRAELRRVLALAPDPDRLPASADEVAAIRGEFGRRATLLTGKAATERAFRAEARHHDIVHLATFGVLNRHNPLFSHVALAPGGRDDGDLQVHEVYDLELTGQLVVLSACQTALASGALADVPVGDDWIGLVQAFLESGASGVLAAQWPVEDRATARLMGRFYHGLGAGQSPAAAFTGAQRAMLRDPATAHPFYWAGFVLNGAARH